MINKSRLIGVGFFLLAIWLFQYALPTIVLIAKFINNENYYIDSAAFYSLGFVMAPFIFAIYLNDRQKMSHVSALTYFKGVLLLSVLSLFSSMLLFLAMAFFLAFRDVYGESSMVFEWLFLIPPLMFLILFGFISRFLYRSCAPSKVANFAI